MQVLLVEPDAILAKAYAAGLESAGHTVRHAVSAQEAIHNADEQTPDIVVVSLEMARHNGIEFLYEFRSYGEWQDVPAVLLTSLPSSKLLGDDIMREQLKVRAVFVRSQIAVGDLVRAIERVYQKQEA